MNARDYYLIRVETLMKQIKLKWFSNIFSSMNIAKSRKSKFNAFINFVAI